MALAADIVQRRSALKAALLRPRPLLDRIPRLGGILRDACERIADAIAAAVPNLSASLDSIAPGTTRDHLGAQWETELCAVLRAKGAPGQLLIHFGPDAMSAFASLALGGQGPVDGNVWPRSGWSRIEIAMARIVAEAVSPILAQAFQGAGIPLAFDLEGVGTDQSAIASACDNVPVFAARIALEPFAVSPWISVLIPLSLIAPYAEKLAEEPREAAAGRPHHGDRHWSRKVEAELAHARVDVTAVLESRTASLETLAELKVGDVLPLDATAQSRMTLESKDVPLFTCGLGKHNGVLMVRIESKVQEGDKQKPAATGHQAADGAPG